jgi:hypothetical protein
MKPKALALLLLFAIALLMIAVRWFYFRPHPAPANSPPVTIQDGKTIDFSSGKPVVKDNPEEKAIIDRASREMEEAAKNVTFAPTAKPTEEKKPAEPSPAPPGKG